MKSIWFINYTRKQNAKAINVKIFHRLKDANNFIFENKIYGYIIRQKETNKFISFFNNFVPTTSDEEHIKNLLKD